MITTKTLSKQETLELIDGPCGKLEMAISQSKERKGWGIVCHPHPLFGGTMNNKVVTTVAKAFQGLGLNTIRFNFRGVGRSAGRFNDGKGELDDLIAVINWLQETHKSYEICLGGFSFGAYVAACAATKIPIKKLVLVAPPVENFHMETLPPITCPWVLVQGEQDDVVNPAKVFEWAESREPKPVILRFPQAGHFFHGELVALRMKLEEVLRMI